MGPKNFWVRKTFWLQTKLWIQKKFQKTSKKISPQKLSQKMFVKIGSVTAEILVIWTNVARTYVAWTNATMTTAIC